MTIAQLQSRQHRIITARGTRPAGRPFVPGALAHERKVNDIDGDQRDPSRTLVTSTAGPAASAGPRAGPTARAGRISETLVQGQTYSVQLNYTGAV